MNDLRPFRRRVCPASAAAATQLALACGAAAQALTPLWVREFGSNDIDHVDAAASDGAGGVFVAGVTYGGLGGPTAGSFDMFVAKYDPEGVRTWVRQVGSVGQESVSSAAPDGAGGVFITGTTYGALPGQTHAGMQDVVLLRYDADGALLWIRQFGTSACDVVTSAAADGAGGVWITGFSAGAIGGPSAGGNDIFIARYDPSGNRAWIRQFGSSAHDGGRGLAHDGAGGMFLLGESNGNLGGVHIGDNDYVLARYNGDGNRLWIRQFGTTGLDAAEDALPAPGGRVYICGRAAGNIGDPNPAWGGAFVGQFGSDGGQLWVRHFTDSLNGGFARALATDGQGGVYVGGDTIGDLGGPSLGRNDAMVLRFTSAGERLWIRKFGTEGYNLGNAVAPDGSGGVYIGGYNNEAGSLSDAYVARLSMPCQANCDRSTTPPILNIADFNCFLDYFSIADPYANCDGSTVAPIINVADFICFMQKFAAGCS